MVSGRNVQLKKSGLKKRYVFAVVLTLLIAIAWWLLHPRHFEAELKDIVYQSTGLQLEYAQVDYSLFNPGQLLVADLVLSQHKQPLLKMEALQLKLAVWPLLQKKVWVENLKFTGIEVHGGYEQLERLQTHLSQSKATSEPPEDESKSASSPVLPVHNVVVKQLSVKVKKLDWQHGPQRLQLDELVLDGHDIVLVKQQVWNPENLTLKAAGKAQSLAYNNLVLSHMAWVLKLEKRQLELEQLTTQVFDGQVNLKARVDLSSAPKIRASVGVSNMNIEVTPSWMAALQGREHATTNSESSSEVSKTVNQSDEDTSEPALPIASLMLADVHLSQIQFQSSLSQLPLSLDLNQLQIENLQLVQDSQVNLTKIESDKDALIAMDVTSLRYQKQLINKLLLDASLDNGVLLLNTLDVVAPGADLAFEGEIQLDQGDYRAQLRSRHLNVDLFPLLRERIPEGLNPQGKLDLAMDLSLPLAQPKPWLLADGKLQLEGKNWTVDKLNLNGILQGLEQSQKTSLLDVGSVLLTGPLGLVYTQVASLGKTGLMAQAGQSLITHINGEIHLQQGKASTDNLALATDKYRAAFKGGIDLEAGEYAPLDFYLLNAKGCATLQQKLQGPLSSPDGLFSEAVSTTVLKPFSNLLSEAADWITQCKPVYEGPVKAP